MPSSNVCWGIEIGAGAIKAIKLVREGEKLTVADFALIAHKRVLSTPDTDPNDAIRVALGALVTQHDLTRATLAISVPGHAAFARFAKLPPVEAKKVPDIVKYEAVQQIPFPIEEVEWDYQTFASDESSQGDDDSGAEVIEVGIFAITRERVMEKLAACLDVNLSPDCLNLSPICAYNAVAYDLSFTEKTPGTVILDIGTTASDLIIADAGRVWVRTFPLGGHNFTEALASTFKLPYRKAEKLKRDAEKSTHKRHIFQAMRPVFSDLAQDVQRSIAYYRQLHPDAELTQMIGVGSTFRLLGLRRFLSQQLQMDVARLDKFTRLSVEGAEASDFQSVTLNLATAYGLALQGVGLATINANLVPVSVIRKSLWQKKTPWFATAAAIALLAGGASFYKPFHDKRQADPANHTDTTRLVSDVKNESKKLSTEWTSVSQQAEIGFTAVNIESLLDRQDIYQSVVSDIGEMFASAERPKQGEPNPGPEAPFDQRRFYILRHLNIDYTTPRGGAPTGPAASVTGNLRKSAEQSAKGRSGGGGGGRGVGGFIGGGRGASRRPPPQDQPQAPQRPDESFGALHFTLVVDATHKGKDYVEQTLLAWLRDNEQRPDAPYTFTTPSIDDVETEQLTGADLAAGNNRSKAAAASGSRRDRRKSGRSKSGSGSAGFGSTQQQGGSASSTLTPSTLEELAPLPPQQAAIPTDVPVYRYTIRWKATLRPPGAEKQSDSESNDSEASS